MYLIRSHAELRLAAAVSILASAAVTAAAQAPFTVIVVPDTQYYSANSTGSNGIFSNLQNQWVLANAAARNIVFYTQLGDVVNTAGPVGAPSAEWAIATEALSIIRASSIPYSVLPGNHDWTSSAGTGSLEHYRLRFGDGSDFFAGQPWFLGFDPRGVNSAQLISTPAGPMLHLALEWNAAAPAVSSDRPAATASPVPWAQSIINAHPGVPTIISTHNNINASGVQDAQGLALFNALAKPNNQVFMILNGHYSNGNAAEARITGINNAGRPVYQILTDYQSRNRGGDGWMRLITFEPANRRMLFSTYTPISDAALGQPAGAEFGNTGREEVDADSRFELPLDFATRFLPPPPPPPEPQTGRTLTLKQGLAGYTGQSDTEIRTSNPSANLGAQGYMHIDTDDTAGGGPAGLSNGLIRFDGIFGGTPGQIAADRDVLRATLRLYTHPQRGFSDGSGFEVRRMLTPWSEASTWNSLTLAGAGITAFGSSGVEALASADAFIGANTGSVNVRQGVWIELDVTRSLRAWRSGSTNFGWLLQAFPNASNAIRVETRESELTGANYPELILTETADTVSLATFTSGVDTTLDQSRPTTVLAASPTISADASVENNADASLSDTQGLIRFTGIFGSEASRIPTGSLISSATLLLNLNANVQFSDGGGFSIHQMLRPWSPQDTWDSLTAGIQTDDIEAVFTPDDVGGRDVLSTVAIPFGRYAIDVTASLRRWAAIGEAANHGWAILPLPNATNALLFDSFDSTAAAALRPELIVRFLAPQSRCLADLNTGSGPDGTVDGADFIAFINSFAIGEPAIDPAADITGGGDGSQPDGTIDGSDFIAFINAFAAGC
jgi:hypothetical protein